MDLATVPEMELDYDLFSGAPILRIGDWDASARWSWVPVFDFATCLRAVVAGLRDDPIGSGTFEFTESDASINVSRVGDVVEVSADYADGTALVPLTEL